MLRKFIFTFIICVVTGMCQAREFPLCVYGVSSTEWVKIVKEAGFTCFQSYKKDPATLAALVKEANKYHLKTVFYPGKIIGSAEEKNAQTWPMLAWYLADEPERTKLSRNRIKEVHATTKQAFPNRPTTLVIGKGLTFIPFYDLPDIMMVDWYPVPHLKLTSFGDNVNDTKRMMTKYGVGGHPLWGVVQIFDWKDYKQHRPDNDRIGRFPTEEEIRFMSYHGIFNGATGLFYFTLAPGGKVTAKENPELWKRVTNVVQEVKKLVPVLEDGILVEGPVEVKSPLAMQTRVYKGKAYLILLNTSGEEQEVPTALLEKYYKEIFGRKKTSKIPPYGVWVLKY